MSDLTALVAISFLGATTIFFSVYVAVSANNLGNQIATGIAQQGAPISTATRKVMLLHMWLPYESVGVALSAIIAIAALQVADHVGAANVKLVAHLMAFVGAVGAVMWVLSGTVCFLHYQRLLNASDQD